MVENTDYNASSIKALDQHQHLLKRLSLTFGNENPESDFSSQKTVSLREIMDNAFDEIRSGHGEYVKLSIFKDNSVEIYDSGRGIPVDVGKDSHGNPASGIYLSLGVIMSGGKFTADSKRFSSGLNGVGASSTIHCSKRADVTVYRNSKKYELSFQDGIPGFFDISEDPDSKFTPLKDLTKLKESKDDRPASEKKKYKTGTKIRVWLRDSVFSSPNPYDDQDLISRFRSTAFLVPELHGEVYNELHLIDGKPQVEEFNFPNGIHDLIEISQPDKKITETLYFNTVGKYLEKNVATLQKDGSIKNSDIEREVPIEVAMRWGDKYETNVSTFVNTIHTKLDGVHLVAFQRALVAAFNERFSSMRGLIKRGEEEPIPEDFMEGLTAIVSVQVAEPVFTSQSKEALSGRELLKAIQSSLTAEFSEWIKDRKNAKTLEVIAKKVVTASQNRQRAKEQKELNRKKNAISSASLPTKLIDCEKAGTEDAELYICEGDSAASSLKSSRDGEIHALLPIRGKIINALLAKPAQLMGNKEVQDIIKALGAGSGKDFDLDKMRYGRVFVAADADPDGLAIATLVYALFWQLFRPAIEDGRFFKIEPPLFVITTKQAGKSRKIYCLDEKERDKETKKLEKSSIKFSVTRCKGLGEMQPDELAETSLDTATRVITQVTIDDVNEAYSSLNMILGPDAQLRKDWLETAEVDTELISD